MFLEIKVLGGLYTKYARVNEYTRSYSDAEAGALNVNGDNFNLTDLPLINKQWSEQENAKWESIQDKLKFSGMLDSLAPETMKNLGKLKASSHYVSSFNKRLENISFGKVGKLTSKYYVGDYTDSDMQYTDFEFVVNNKAAQYDPVDQKIERIAAEKEFESIYARLLFMSMYKSHFMINEHTDDDTKSITSDLTTWKSKLEAYDKTNLHRYLSMAGGDKATETISDYFNEYIAAELTNLSMILSDSTVNDFTEVAKNLGNYGSELKNSKVWGVNKIGGKVEGAFTSLNDIIKKTQQGNNAVLNPLKIQFAVYEKDHTDTDENGNAKRKYMINHLDNIYSTDNVNVISHLNQKLNEFIITSLVITPNDNNYIEHTYQRKERGVVDTVEDYKYPESRVAMFPKNITVKLRIKNNRKFILNEWIEYFNRLSE